MILSARPLEFLIALMISSVRRPRSSTCKSFLMKSSVRRLKSSNCKSFLINPFVSPNFDLAASHSRPSLPCFSAAFRIISTDRFCFSNCFIHLLNLPTSSNSLSIFSTKSAPYLRVSPFFMLVFTALDRSLRPITVATLTMTLTHASLTSFLPALVSPVTYLHIKHIVCM